MDAETQCVIAGYRSKLMSSEEWAVAGPAVRALVSAAGPADPTAARQLLAATVTFLVWSCGWDRCTPPDLALLLTETAVDRFAATAKHGEQARAMYRSSLRSLLRARSGGVRPRRSAARTGPGRSPMQRAAELQGVSGAAVGDAYRRLTGEVLGASRLAIVRPVADPGHAWAGLPGPGVVGALLVAPNVEPVASAGIAPASLVRSGKVARAESGRSRLAFERAGRQAAAGIVRGRRVADPPDLGALPVEARTALEGFVPDLDPTVWAQIRDLTVRMVASTDPPSPYMVHRTASHVAVFLAWVTTAPGRANPGTAPTAEELVGSSLLEEFLADGWRGRRVARAAVTGSTRSGLRQAVVRLDADHVTVSGTRAVPVPPYRPGDCDTLAEIAMAQPTLARQRFGCFTVGLALGAGLSPTDVRHVRYRDVQTLHDESSGDFMVVRVPAGRVRTVVVRREYEPLLLRAMSLQGDLPDGHRVLGTRTGAVARRGRLVTARTGQVLDINPWRMCNAWRLAALNAPVPMAVVMQQAGVATGLSIAELVALCPTGDPVQVTEAMQVLDRSGR